MRRTWMVAVAVSLAGGLVAMPAAQAENIGDQGCTPGYWKTHTDNWYDDVVGPDAYLIPTTKRVSSEFDVSEEFEDLTFLAALQGGGGPGLLGAERVLLRAAVAAWLNAAHEGLGYPYRRANDPYNIVETVDAAIASGSRAEMLSVAAALDEANNLGCPLS